MINSLLPGVTVALMIVWAVLTFAVGYLLLLMFAAATKRRPPPPAREWRTFRIVVPAHNDAVVLAPVLQRLATLEYPRTHYQIMVIADQCSDDTVRVVRSYGARVLERCEPHLRGKGYALAAAFAALRNERFDAFVVLSADTLADPAMLQVFNRYLAAGQRVIQARHEMLHEQPTPRTALGTVAWRIGHYVQPLGRRALGGSAALRGNGMCLGKEVIERYPWTAFSPTADVEYTSTLVRNHQPITFAPEAKFATLLLPARRAAHEQRGHWAITQRHGWRFLLAGLWQRNWRWFDQGMDLLLPSLGGLGLAVLGGTIAALAVAVIAPSTPMIGMWCLWLALAGALAVFVLDALLVSGAPWTAYRALIAAPGYALWWVWLYVRLAADQRPPQWERDGRTRTHR